MCEFDGVRSEFFDLTLFFESSAGCNSTLFHAACFSDIIAPMRPIILLIIIYLAFISLGLPDSLLGAAWPVMHRYLSVPVHDAGIVSMIIAGGTVISSLLSGRIIARFGTSGVTAASVVMTATPLLGFSVSHDFAYLCLWAVPLGLGAGSVDAALNNYVALHYKAIHMNWLRCFWGVGASVGPLIMSANLAGNGSWHHGYRIVALIQFALALIVFASVRLWATAGRSCRNRQSGDRHVASFRSQLRLPGLAPMLAAGFFLIGFGCAPIYPSLLHETPVNFGKGHF